MALLWVESMDKYSNTSDNDIFNDNFNWTGDTVNPGDMEATSGRFGGQAYRCQSRTSPADLRIPLSAAGMSGTTAVIAFAFRFGATATASDAVQGFLDCYDAATGGTQHFSLAMTPAGSFVMFPATGAAFYSAPNVFYHRVWHWLELKVSFLDAGSFELRIDGVAVLSGSGDFRAGTGNTSTIHSVRLTGSDDSGNDDSMLYGDIVILDGSGSAPYNDFLGDLRIENTIPNADGAVANWTPLSSTNVSNIDDALAAYDGNTTYISSNTDEQVNLAAHVDHALTNVNTIKFAQLSVMAAKETAGKNVAPRVVSGATSVDGATITPLVQPDYTWCNAIWTVDPNTSSAWTKANINAAEWGVKTKA